MATKETIFKFGRNSDVDVFTGPEEDVIAATGLQYWPASVVAAANINVVSDDANDTALGTGARTLRLFGVDTDHLMQGEVLALNGTTAVNPVNDYLRIYRARVITNGSHANGNNVGNITIADGTGTMAFISAARGQTQQASYTVPANFNRAIMRILTADMTHRTTAGADVALNVREPDSSWQTRHIMGVGSNSSSSTPPLNFDRDDLEWLKFIPKTDIRLTVIEASADSLTVFGAFGLELRP